MRAPASACTPRSNNPLAGARVSTDNRAFEALLLALRAVGERGLALFTGRWRGLEHVTISPSKIGHIIQPALVLTHFEHSYLPH
ncbi:hypothetical protein ABZU76_07460 [Amycolatopsis sp. NPDC005232]|uniref:hypothetical protein n=1 Tax=Amycolatopsis sp. NPDC005232 TaxID=3157027 RepID=UPI0033B9F40F